MKARRGMVATTGTRCHRRLVGILAAERKKAGIRQIAVSASMKERPNWMSRLESGQRRRIDVCEFILLSQIIGFDPVAALQEVLKVAAKKKGA